MKMAPHLKLLFVACLILVIYFILVQVQLPLSINNIAERMPLQEPILKPTVRYFHYGSHLLIVKSVFESLGYVTEIRNTSQWDVLWSHVYPFHVLRQEMHSLKPYQKVNHFPGTAAITLKSSLISLIAAHIPQAFILPDQKDIFSDYVSQNPKKLWIQKSNSHRGIQVLDVANLDYEKKGTFVQEYIQKPLLISGRKFDIGMYAVLTSVDPLRVYMYSSDILLRFCEKEYYPFNSSVLESYVVGDDYLPVWKVPALKRFYADLNYNAKETLNIYLHSQKKNPKKMWSQIAEAIQDVFIKTESAIIDSSLKFGHLRNFFELFRFDFVVDEDLKVFLLEANMSPNLSAEHFPPNRLLYEQVMFNLLSIIGIVRKFPNTLVNRNEMEVSERDVQVFPDECNSKACNNSCKIQKCHVCFRCMTSELKAIAKAAYFEHMNRNKFRRLIPVPIPVMLTLQEPTEDPKIVRSSAMNNFMDRWFKGKCLQDLTFCQ